MKTKDLKYFVFVFGLLLFDSFLKITIARLTVGREVVFAFMKIGMFPNYHGLFGLVGISGIILASLVIFILLAVLFWKSVNKIERFSLLFVFSGGLMNFIDRIKLGYVQDNFAIGNLGYFNLADLLIGVGIFVLVLEIIPKNRHIKKFK